MLTSETKNRINACRALLAGKLHPLNVQRVVVKRDEEASQIEAVRALLPHYGAKIQRVLARVWGTATAESPNSPTWA